MLLFTPSQQIQGYQVFGDDKDSTLFYVMPDAPSIRTNPDGTYAFNFIEYLMPAVQPGATAAAGSPPASAGGGFLIFDTVFIIPPAAMAAIQKQLNKQLNAGGGSSRTAKVGIPNFIPDSTDPKNPTPTSALNILDASSTSGSAGGTLVQSISSANKPSLFGSLISSFTAGLSTSGAAVVKAALPQKGGVIQVFYNLNMMAVLPPIKARVWFNADKFASFNQSIQKSGGSWDSGNNTENETMKEKFINSQSGGVELDFSSLGADPNAATIEAAITGWANQQINVAVQNVMAATAAPASGSTDGSSGGGSSGSGAPPPGVTGQNTGADIGNNRGSDGMDHVTRNETSQSHFSFDETYTERLGYSFPVTLQGTLESIPNLAKYTEQVNANDPFFARLYGNIQINADFTKYGIQSVVVSVTYGAGTGVTPIVSHIFNQSGDILDWISNTVGGKMSYNYSFQVNYLDQSSSYQSPTLTTNNLALVINASDLNVLFVEMEVTNVDFTKVSNVLLEVKYPDADAGGKPIDSTFSFNAKTLTASLVAILKGAATKPYQYQLIYGMADGSKLVQPWVSSNKDTLYINNPFSLQTFSFISEGDFANQIDNIFLKLTYVDSAHNYQQSGDYTFSNANRTYDWAIPVVSNGQGTVHYSGVVSNKNQTTENIPDTTSTENLITFGPPNQAIVTVTADASLLDFTKVTLVQVNFSYADAANNIALQQEVVLKAAGSTPPSWTFYVKDPTKTAYTYQATFFMTGPPVTQVKQASATSTDTDLVLTMPS